MVLIVRTRLLALLLATVSASCQATPVVPSPDGVSSPSDTATIVGNIAVAFLNRFSASTVSPEACLVDFSNACSGRADELHDIQNNRKYFEIVGARLGAPTVVINGAGTSASISLACSWDSRVVKCDTVDCEVGEFGSVGGTCLLTAVKEAGEWKLCVSNFSGRNITPANRLFFGDGR